MTNAFNREDLLDHLVSLMHDPQYCEMLQGMSDAQLKIVAETLDDLSRRAPERRGVGRRSVMRRVQVSPTKGNAFRTQYGLQEDISDHGVGLFLHRPVPLWTRIRIRSDGRDSIGIVRRCKEEKGGWTIGVALERSGPANIEK
jgi:hypothetical protein